jgi:hypothetical protein
VASLRGTGSHHKTEICGAYTYGSISVQFAVGRIPFLQKSSERPLTKGSTASGVLFCKQEGDRRGSNPRPSEPQSADPCFQALPYVAETACLRASANRLGSAVGSSLPAVANPPFSDEPPYDDVYL